MALTAKKVYAILKHQISDMEAKLNSPVRYRGTVATADLLPLNPDIGDMYNIESKSVYGEAGMNVAWNGVVWDTMGAPIDMSLYLTKEEAETVIQRLVTEYFEKNPVKPGATTEQAQQIEQNKTDIASLKTETGSLKEDLSNKITKFYASNQGETHITDSDNGKIMDMMLYGKSEQKRYSGKNLLNYDAWKDTLIVRGTAIYENNGITLAATRNDCYTEMDLGTGFSDNAKIEVSEGETLTLSWEEIENKSGYIYIFGNGIASNGIYVNNRGSKKLSYTVPSGITFITFRFGVDTAGDTISYKNIQIEKGSTATTYEPYTGGIPSPNPDYPQEIKSVVNPTIKICGKNLLKATLQTTTVNGVTCTNNGDGTYTLNGTATTITTFDIAQDVSCSSFRLVGCPVGGAHDASYELQARTNNLIYGYDTGDGKNIKADENFFIRIRINAGINCNNLLFKPMIVDASLYPDATYDDFEPYHKQTVTLPYTLNAIPVSSGGNVTIDGQQYVADYVDVERGKVVKRVKVLNISNLDKSKWGFRTDTSVAIGHSTRYYGTSSMLDFDTNINAMSNIAIYGGIGHDAQGTFRLVDAETYLYQFNLDKTKFDKVQDFTDYLASNNVYIQYALKVPQELDLKPEEIVLFKSLSANYPTTNISINSEQLDGYTVFNYPISMQNGWNYVKQQIGDTREYIYDMDARAQDTDLQAAEAYVNSEYAVVLTELEV